jgi:Kef-type K+ transport system membrane component KefB
LDVSIWPTWPQTFPPLVHLAVALLFAALAGMVASRRLGLPQVTGYSLAGLLLGPAVFGWFGPEDFVGLRPVMDLALAVLLFELGVRVDLRWFRANPWVLGASLVEAALAFGLCFGAMLLMGYKLGLAAAVGTIAIGTSPAVVTRVTAELRAEGQVTQRLLVLTALNAGYSVIITQLLVGAMHGMFRGDWLTAVLHPLYLLVGSVLLGLALAGAFVGLRRQLDFSDEQGVAVLFGLLLLTLGLVEVLHLPALLAPLAAGIILKNRDPRPFVWPRHFGTAGGVLVIGLFILTGIPVTRQHLLAGGLAALALILVRSVAKLAGAMLGGPLSGLSLRQSIALGVSLAPLSAVALLLVEDVRALYPDFGTGLAPIILSMVAVLELLGPILVQKSLLAVGEKRESGS